MWLYLTKNIFPSYEKKKSYEWILIEEFKEYYLSIVSKFCLTTIHKTIPNNQPKTKLISKLEQNQDTKE